MRYVLLCSAELETDVVDIQTVLEGTNLVVVALYQIVDATEELIESLFNTSGLRGFVFYPLIMLANVIEIQCS